MMRAALFAAALAASVVKAQQPGDITVVGNTKVSAMMMWLGTDEKVYILDKAENNAEQIAGHPAYAAVWDIATKKAEAFEVMSNPFCAAGSSLPDGSWVTFGGNNAVTPNASQTTGVQDYNGDGASPVYGTYDGRKAIRILKPCDGSPASWANDCKEQREGQMAKLRWYATSEALGDGSIIIIGGMVYGGYINRSDRWFKGGDRDPVSQFRNAENTLEFYPPRPNLGDNGVVTSQFLVDAGGLNTYTHAYLMPSGRLFLNANISNTLLDLTDMSYHPLPNDPTNTVRVYPASAGVAMLPLTPENNWTPTILFCGGTSALTEQDWGSYGGPGANVWEKRASDDCQRLTPEPSNGAAAAYEQDDAMPDPRTMGQFVILPDGTYLMVNGARMGTAGYTTQTPLIPNLADMPYYMSCATDPVMTPAIYDPSKPRGQRWITAGLKASTVPRLYHSTAILLPDGAVMVAGSNPGADVTVKADNIPYPTEYDAEYWYPPYYNKARPNVTGIPQKLGYGGAYFNLTLAAGQFQNPNDAAAKTKVVLMRPGYTTHSMTMGQRYMQLNSTYNVGDDGKITLSVSPPPPNANLLTPGPTVFFVVVNGVPSIGKHMIVGSGAVGTQPTTPAMPLPANVLSTKFNAVGSGNGGSSDGSSNGEGSDEGGLSVGVYAGIAAGAVAVLALIGFCFWRRRKSSGEDSSAATTGAHGRNPYATRDITPPVAGNANPYGNGGSQMAQTQTSINAPVTQHHDYSAAAAATPRRSDASHSPRSPPAHDQPQVYNSQPQREYQGQGGYDNGGYQQGDYQQGGYQQGYGQQHQQHGYDQGGRY